LPAKWRFKAALGFAECESASHISRDEHLKYIKNNAAKLVEHALGSEALLALMCREKLISAKNAPLYMEAAQKSGNAQAIAMLLEYNANRLSTAEKERAARSKEAAEDTVVERKIRRQTKVGIDGLSFVVTGDLETFEKRAQLKEFVLSRGGKMVSAMSSKVDYLIMNDATADTEKQKRAEELGIEVITERQFNEIAGRAFIIETGVLKKYFGAGGDIVIPDSVTSIGDWAFYCCSSLTSVVIPEGVTSIGDDEFWGCSSLKGVVLPDSVTSIGNSAFFGCIRFVGNTIRNIIIACCGWE
jgi:hypothetical protein